MAISSQPSYDTDYYAWTQTQAAALRRVAELRLNLPEVDLEHLAEEIEGMGRSDRRALARQLERVLLHLLKWQVQPGLRGISWQRSIASARHEIEKLLEDSPSLRNEIGSRLDGEYRAARQGAIAETGLVPTLFPKTCPFTVEQILVDAGLGETVSDD